MIQHGRDAVDVAGVAQLAGMPLSTWRRKRHTEFAATVAALPGSKRPLLYDVAQVHAWLAGNPLPQLETNPAPHPDDLLTDAEVAKVVGVSPGTVRDEAADGRMHPGEELAGRRFWRRAVAEERRDRPKAYRGRTPGAKNRQPRDRPTDERARQVAAELAAAERGARKRVTAAELAERYGVSVRTAERTMARALELAE